MMRAFLLFPFLTVACTSADGLNLGQRGYLVQDSRLALEATAKLSATALFAELFLGERTMINGASSEENVERVVNRANALLANCPGAVVTATYGGVDISMDCERDGLRWRIDDNLHIVDSTYLQLKVDLLAFRGEIGGVELVPADITFPSGEPLRISADNWSFRGRGLEFTGTIEADAEFTTATLTGSGQWVDRSVEGSELPVTLDAFAVRAATCAPTSGTLSIGPRDVLIDPETSVPIAQRVTPGPASGQATLLVGVTEETVTVGCPGSEYF